MKTWISLVLIAFAGNAFAASVRTLDGAQITNGSATLTLPTSTDTMVGRDTTDTLSNKTISGASNTISNVPAGTALSGQVPIANGGTNATSASGARTNLGAAASGANSDITSLSGLTTALSVSQGGTGQASLSAGNVILGNGTSGVSVVAPGTSGNILTSNGSTWTSSAPPSTSPSVSGSQASPTSITAAGGVSFSGSNYFNIQYIQGSGGAVTVTATPQIAAGSLVGQQLILICTSATNTVTFADGNGLSLNGSLLCGDNSAIQLNWNGSLWTEVSRR